MKFKLIFASIIIASVLGVGGYVFLAPKGEYIEGNILNVPQTFSVSTRESLFTPDWISNGFVSSLLFRPLIIPNHDHTTFTPDLAQNFNVSDGGLTYTFIIKTGQKWSDGSTITVDDVLYTFERSIASENTDAPLKSSFKYINSIEHSGNTITFRLTRPDRNFLQTVSRLIIIPQSMLKNHRIADFYANEYWKNPVVSGMYMLDNVVEGEYYELIPNPFYTGGAKPKIEKVRVHQDPKHSLDLYPTISIAEIMSLRAVRGLQEYNVPAYFMRYIAYNILNNDDPKSPMEDMNLRRAIGAAIDTDSILKDVYQNIGEVHRQNPQGKLAIMGYDPELAKELLSKSNYDMNRPLRIITHFKLASSLYIVQSVADNLMDIGFKVEIKYADSVEEVLSRKDYDILFKDFSGSVAADRFSSFMPDQPLGKIFGENKELQNVIDAAIDAQSDEIYNQLINKAAIILTDLHYRFPLVNVNQSVYVNINRVKLPPNMHFCNFTHITDLRFAEWEILRKK